MAHEHIINEHILNIVQSCDIHEQSELQDILQERGYQVPQATLSRLLRKLKIAKVSGIYKVTELNMPNLPTVLNIQVSELGLIVIHTHPGNANSLAYFIDQKYVTYNPRQPKHSGILGTIAGDDSILVIIKSKDSLSAVLDIFRHEFPYLSIA